MPIIIKISAVSTIACLMNVSNLIGDVSVFRLPEAANKSPTPMRKNVAPTVTLVLNMKKRSGQRFSYSCPILIRA